jgi:hypothetical protein
MDYHELCARVFSADKRIRYATVTDSRCNILAGGMRLGVQPLEATPEAAQRIDLQVAVLDGIMHAWAESIGGPRFALIRHEKAYMLIIPFDNKHVELSIERDMTLEEIGGIVSIVEDAARESSPEPS